MGNNCYVYCATYCSLSSVDLTHRNKRGLPEPYMSCVVPAAYVFFEVNNAARVVRAIGPVTACSKAAATEKQVGVAKLKPVALQSATISTTTKKQPASHDSASIKQSHTTINPYLLFTTANRPARSASLRLSSKMVQANSAAFLLMP